MDEFMLVGKMSIEVVKSKIWKMFDVLRTENTSSHDYNIILFLLSTYKDGIISSDLFSNKQDLKERLIERLFSSKNEVSEEYKKIIPNFTPSIQKLSHKGLSNIIEILYGIEKQVLIDNFPDIFDGVLYRIAQSQGRMGGEFIQPLEITRLICGLFKLPKGSKVFNPFAGLASFGVFLADKHKYYGQEINLKTWALGVLRIMAYGKMDSCEYVCADSIFHWPDDSQKFDLIISNPPLGLKLGSKYKEIAPQIRVVDHFLVENVFHSLSDEGKLITVLPHGFLFRGSHEKKLRQALIDEDLIDTIISLPGGLLFNTGIPFIILVINKKKKTPGKVRFIKADKYVENRNVKEKVLKDHALISLINGEKEDEDSLRIVDNTQILNLDYNMHVPRYFQQEIELAKNEELVKLKDILEFIKGEKVDSSEKGKFVRIRDLSDDKADFKLDVSDIENVDLSRPGFYQISETCLLLAVRWRSLKPTFFQYEYEPIYRNSDILSFRLNENIADYGYVINELHADYIGEQLEAYRIGETIPYIRRDDLLEIAIKLPSLEEQRAKVKGISELSYEIKRLLIERKALAHGNLSNHYNEFASLKHTLGRPRQNILDWSDNLLDFFNNKKEGFEELNKAFYEFYDFDIISALKEIKRDVNFITDVLEKGVNGLVLSEYEKQIIPLSDINSIINELSSYGFIFKIKKLLLKGEKLKERGIYANKTLFKTLLDNILTNANKYAFDRKSTGNEVVIELTEIDDSLSMEIRNNGKPFPKNLDREKFITKYSTADSNNGSGLGGYDIHRIASDFNNPNWILSLDEDPFFPVKFKFQFPINLIN